MSHDTWRELAEKASEEQDPERLGALVKNLTKFWRNPPSAERERLTWLRQQLNREELH